METRTVCIAVAFIAAWLTTAAASEMPMELVGANGKGIQVVFSPQPWRVCEAGVGSGLIFYKEGDKITEVWPHQRCSFEMNGAGKLQFSCVSEDGPQYSYSKAVYVMESRSGASCSYVCRSGCGPHVPQTLRSTPMVPIMPPLPPPPQP